MQDVDFSGTWVVDKARSGSMEDILKLMGLPWLAVRLVLSLDVTTEVAHTPSLGLVRTIDRTSLGVLSTNELESNNEEVSRTGKDGRTALLRCSLLPRLPQGCFQGCPLPPPAGGGEADGGAALAYLRITTQLPDGEGVSDNVWEMRGGGRVMQAFTTFTKGSRVARASRVLVNKAWVEGRVPLALLPPPESPRPMESPPRPTVAEQPQGSPFRLPYAEQEREEDPFFVSLAGCWGQRKLVLTQSPGALRGLLVAGLVGVGFPGVLAGLCASASCPPPEVGSALGIVHSRGSLGLSCSPLFRCRSGSGEGGGGAPPFSLDGQWRWCTAVGGGCRVLARAIQSEGQGDLGPHWLGHEVGDLPAAFFQGMVGLPGVSNDVRLPYFSSSDFNVGLYSGCEVRMEVVLVQAGGVSGAWQHTLLFRGEGAGECLWVGVSPATPLGVEAVQVLEQQPQQPWGPQYPEGMVWGALVRAPVVGVGSATPQSGSSGASGDAAPLERARLAHVRAVILQRRAQGDAVRKRFLIEKQRQEGGAGDYGAHFCQ
jgi:hypothetical protein